MFSWKFKKILLGQLPKNWLMIAAQIIESLGPPYPKIPVLATPYAKTSVLSRTEKYKSNIYSQMTLL